MRRSIFAYHMNNLWLKEAVSVQQPRARFKHMAVRENRHTPVLLWIPLGIHTQERAADADSK
jgi:hypothetical protein